jgi:glycosyltransferase involved in cell wall biosynthesis
MGSRFDDDADVILAGLVDDPYPAIAGAALLMLPSQSEGLPMVLLEALTLGIPVIAADCPSGGVYYALAGISGHDVQRTAVQHTSCGALLPIPVNENSCASWAIETIALLNDSRALADLGEGARTRSRAFTMEAALERWRHILA